MNLQVRLWDIPQAWQTELSGQWDEPSNQARRQLWLLTRAVKIIWKAFQYVSSICLPLIKKALNFLPKWYIHADEAARRVGKLTNSTFSIFNVFNITKPKSQPELQRFSWLNRSSSTFIFRPRTLSTPRTKLHQMSALWNCLHNCCCGFAPCHPLQPQTILGHIFMHNMGHEWFQWAMGLHTLV